MVEIPLILKLRRQVHKNIAKAQDLIIDSLYKFFEKAVLHGGTSIWRCYSGNRFSEDVDVYIPKTLDRINSFFIDLEKKGFVINKKKIGENSIFSSMKFNDALVRFEALFSNIKGEIKDYETAEGNLIVVYTLSPESLIKEKIETYLKRLKIRDFYDVFFLLKYVKDKTPIKTNLKKLITNFKKPVDDKELRVLIIEGITPNVEEMLTYVKREI